MGGDDQREPGADGRGRPPADARGVLAVCERWELHNAVIGEVTDTGLLRAFWEDEVVGEIPARLLTDECPRYASSRSRARSRTTAAVWRCSTRRRTPALLELLGSPNMRSREPIYRRYDHLVGSRTVRRPGLDAAVLRLRPGYRGLAVSLDGHGRMGPPRPAHGRRAGRARGGAKRRLHRRRAARPDRLPQLRQPGEGRDRLGARASRSRGWPRRARRCGSRSSRATSRSTTRPTGARSTRLRSSAASACSTTCARCRAAGARAT